MSCYMCDKEETIITVQRGGNEIGFCSEKCANDLGYYQCKECGEFILRRRMLSVNGEHYCKECALKTGLVTLCADCGDYAPTDEIVTLKNGLKVCADCAELYAECYFCGDVHRRRDMMLVDGKDVCKSCMNDKVMRCPTCHNWHIKENVVYDKEKSIYCCDNCKNRLVKCDECGKYFIDSFFAYIGDERICHSCFDRIGTYCHNCGMNIRRTDAVELDGRDYCESCADNFQSCPNCGVLCLEDDIITFNGESRCVHCGDFDGINTYGYKPCPNFNGNSNDSQPPLYLGVENEVDRGDDAEELCKYLHSFFDNIYCKHDGSLGDEGVEIVSHPATLAYHTNNMKWKQIFKLCLNQGYLSHDTTTCGLHVHVNRDFFGDDQIEQDLNIAKVVLLINRFWDSHIVPFSRRNISQLDEYAKKVYSKVIYKDENERSVASKIKASSGDGRYQAVNLQNNNTIELRVFRGTLRYETFIATLQFVDTLCRFAKKVKLRDIDVTKWEDIFEGTDYVELNDYMQKRVSFDPSLVANVLKERKSCDTAKACDIDRGDVQVGDRIRIREWDDMEEEFGARNGDIRCQFNFTEPMEYLCGATGTVLSVDYGGEIEIEFDDCENSGFCFSTDMIEIIGRD